MSSVWGERLKISLFGESHGPAVGVVMDGLPAGERVDTDELRAFLRRRAPGSALGSGRAETDEPEVLSGLTHGHTNGAPLALRIPNRDARGQDYAALRHTPRPGHADYPAFVKYGGWADSRGGGHFSGRLTAPLCAAGAVALQLLQRRGVAVAAHALSLGPWEDACFPEAGFDENTARRLREAELPILRASDAETLRRALTEAAAQGDSIGGVVECMALGLPVGLGGPLFGGLESRLAPIVFAIPAVKGLDFGAGFEAARLRGSENNDPYALRGGRVVTTSNRAGGILGGMSTGMPLRFRAAFKPTPSIALPQRSVDLACGEETELRVCGRHDPSVVLRAVPAVEAAAALALLDVMLEEAR